MQQSFMFLHSYTVNTEKPSGDISIKSGVENCTRLTKEQINTGRHLYLDGICFLLVGFLTCFLLILFKISGECSIYIFFPLSYFNLAKTKHQIKVLVHAELILHRGEMQTQEHLWFMS